ncbi:hypothetical protein MPSD_26710 [Mycobacterium pseudoshottsii JCM 15466]|nr:hypothetical protein MPSD_26710 [Mycobacterium pseudoshottsii JCM 15466]
MTANTCGRAVKASAAIAAVADGRFQGLIEISFANASLDSLPTLMTRLRAPVRLWLRQHRNRAGRSLPTRGALGVLRAAPITGYPRHL